MTSTSSFPSRITVRAYQVGFGDCLLLTFHYEGEDKRHVLIDFGSTAAPEGAPERQEMLRRIARHIAEECRKLHLVVATHRHADHINGFATATRKGDQASGDIIRECDPELVLQPWTEDPKAPANPIYGEETDRRSFVKALDNLHAFSDRVEKELRRLQRAKGIRQHMLGYAKVLTENNLRAPANRSASENLSTLMGRKGERARYLAYGDELNLEHILPGVKVHVLGPPTLKQSCAIRRQRRSDPDEYWQFYARAGILPWQQLMEAAISSEGGSAPLFGSVTTPAAQWAPQHARWFVRRLGSLRTEQLLEMVRILDGVLNNTSLILLFEVGDQMLLFPGDAQLENWSYALRHKDPRQKEQIEKLLKGVTLYKVGHHGSRNATPKSLWKLIQKEGLHCVLSTKEEQHGHVEQGTEVPRTELVKELKKHKYYSTQGLQWMADGKPPFLEVEVKPAPPAIAPPVKEGELSSPQESTAAPAVAAP